MTEPPKPPSRRAIHRQQPAAAGIVTPTAVQNSQPKPAESIPPPPEREYKKRRFGGEPEETSAEITAEAWAIRLAERTQKAIRLRAQGWKYSDISKELGIPRTTVLRCIHGELEKIRTDCRAQAETILQHDLEVTNRLLLAALPAAEDGSLRHQTAVLKLLDRRSKYLGLDAPTKTDGTLNLNGNIGLTFRPREQLRSQLMEKVTQLRNAKLGLPMMPAANGKPEVGQGGELLYGHHNGNGNGHYHEDDDDQDFDDQ